MGAFTATMTGLVPGTRYYVRSYSVPTKGYIYGNELSFITSTSSALPVVTTSLPSIVNGQISSGGNITNLGGTPVTARGICWSKSENPTNLLPTKTIFATTSLSGYSTGSFTANTSGILEENVTYYVRAFASNSSGTSYGRNESVFIMPTTPLPIVKTSAISLTQPGTVVAGGNVTYSGSSTVTQRGICWSTSVNPTNTLSTKTIDGVGTGSFSSTATSLLPFTKYYFRAYAVNSSGTAYGDQMSFTTGGQITDLDGNVYETVLIGTKEWMKQNLRVTKYRNGESITTALDGNSWANYTFGAYAAYNDATENISRYGLLYNWFAVTDPRGVCPAGWHIPSNLEFGDMINLFGGSTVAGGSMKAVSSLWTSPNTEATNNSAFSGLPAGKRGGYGTGGFYGGLGTNAYFWSFPSSPLGQAYWLENIKGSVSTLSRINPREGNSVRCVKD
jgi:uncharacterized protein (TIGR02145 family)